MKRKKILLLATVLALLFCNTAGAGPLDRLDANRYGPGTLIAAMEELSDYLPPQAVEPLIQLVGHPDNDVARTAGWLLRRMGEGAAGAAAAGAVLADPEATPEERMSAAICAGQLRHANGRAALADALANDPEETVRSSAAEALGELYRPGSVSDLSLAIESDESPLVRAAAVLAYSKVPDADGRVLVAALQDVDAVVRRQAAWALVNQRFADTEGLIGNLLRVLQSDEDCRAQAAAAWALGKIGDPSTAEALESAQSGACRLTAQAAAFAIKLIE